MTGNDEGENGNGDEDEESAIGFVKLYHAPKNRK